MGRYGLPLVGAELLVCAGMVAITVLAFGLWRTGNIQHRAGAALLLVESVALSVVVVPALAYWLSLALEPPTLGLAATWGPAVAGIGLGTAVALGRNR